jgi:hypothetical protein
MGALNFHYFPDIVFHIKKLNLPENSKSTFKFSQRIFFNEILGDLREKLTSSGRLAALRGIGP